LVLGGSACIFSCTEGCVAAVGGCGPGAAASCGRWIGAGGSHKGVIKDLVVFAKNFYTANFVFCGDLTQFLITSFRRMVVEKFGLWQQRPTKFELYNRWNRSRACKNFMEVMAAVKSEWSQFPWEECPHVKGIEQSALFFDQVKFLFAIHGSVLANMILMQDETAIVSMEMEQWLLSFFWLSGYTGKYHIVGCDQRISYRGMEPNRLDVPHVLSLFRRALELLKLI
jgi:hypothetical protein